MKQLLEAYSLFARYQPRPAIPSFGHDHVLTVSVDPAHVDPADKARLTALQFSAGDPEEHFYSFLLRSWLSQSPGVPEAMAATAAGLVAVLGWGVDDFEASCREASPDVLRGALEILLSPDPPSTPEWAVERAKWGATFIQRLLSPS